MKRRNIESGKLPRRPIKRSPKISENVYSGSFVYLKFVGIWLLILLADFILEFRFEYVWPAWLLIQSVYETFKYQGLIYAVFFVCIAITTDTVCVLLIPIQYLFILASTYVWVQYVWHTDKGFCLPTAILWLIIMYVEITVRLQDLKVGLFQISLCQPFAAHCIGHPIITLGIGFKSYVIYRIKLRTQRQVRKENLFHFELLKQALPDELQNNHVLSVTDHEKNDVMQHCNGTSLSHNINTKKVVDKSQKSNAQDSNIQAADLSSATLKQQAASTNSNSPTSHRKSTSKETSNSYSSKPTADNDTSFLPSSETDLRKRNSTSTQSRKNSSLNSETFSNSLACKNSNKSNSNDVSNKSHKLVSIQKQSHGDNCKTFSANNGLSNINDVCKEPSLATSGDKSYSKYELASTSSIIEQLETSVMKLKSELASAQKSNSSTKHHLDVLTVSERAAKAELASLKRDHESLQMKFSSLLSNKEKDRNDLQTLEKRLKAETESRDSTEKLLQEEKRRRKEDEATATIALNNRDKESAQVLRVTKCDLEERIRYLEKQLNEKEASYKQLENKLQDQQYCERAMKESETLMSALEAMQEKNMLLEKSLSAETRLKLDLFSALGDAKRQIEISHATLFKREGELNELKARMSDFLSIMPEQRQMRSSTPHYSANFLEKTPSLIQLAPPQEYPAPYCPPHPVSPLPGPSHQASIIQAHPNMEQNLHMQTVHLDPNAAVYTPNTSGV